MPKLYPKEAGFSMTGSALLPDSTIEQIATCGECVDTLPNLQRRARWFLMANHGQEILQELQRIFQDHDANANEASESPRPPGDIFDLILGGASRGRARGGRGRARGASNRGRGRQPAITTSNGELPRRGRSATNRL